MNFPELKAELAARGFDYLGDDRQGQYINWATNELMDLDFWPFRLIEFDVGDVGSVDLTALVDPLLMGPVDSVYDYVNNRYLAPISQQSLEVRGVDLNQTGTPLYWYLPFHTSYSDNELFTWPVGGKIKIRMWISTPDMSGDFAFPLVVPPRYHRIIIDIAVRMAYRDADDHEAANALQQQIDHDVNAMRTALCGEPNATSDTIQTTERW